MAVWKFYFWVLELSGARAWKAGFLFRHLLPRWLVWFHFFICCVSKCWLKVVSESIERKWFDIESWLNSNDRPLVSQPRRQLANKAGKSFCLPTASAISLLRSRCTFSVTTDSSDWSFTRKKDFLWRILSGRLRAIILISPVLGAMRSDRRT